MWHSTTDIFFQSPQIYNVIKLLNLNIYTYAVSLIKSFFFPVPVQVWGLYSMSHDNLIPTISCLFMILSLDNFNIIVKYLYDKRILFVCRHCSFGQYV